MITIASQITSLAIAHSTVYSDAYQRKHQSSTSLAFVRGIHRWPVNSPHKGPVTRKMFPFDDVIMIFFPQSGSFEVWRKPLVDSSVAFALLNLGTDGTSMPVGVKISDLGLTDPSGYRITDVFTNTVVAKVTANETFTAKVNPTGIFLGKATKVWWAMGALLLWASIGQLWSTVTGSLQGGFRTRKWFGNQCHS